MKEDEYEAAAAVVKIQRYDSINRQKRKIVRKENISKQRGT